ncbi:hypothetical protein L915_16998 [Phytophthora nicotianae]|uniref:Uncharacterized protein n=2 Tax=Phytophthora nicotianae TaxID=4792 RepID=W2G128_PHYNI|nr:hypothetical protein L915_16998 [Phytophthora nicotianae]
MNQVSSEEERDENLAKILLALDNKRSELSESTCENRRTSTRASCLYQRKNVTSLSYEHEPEPNSARRLLRPARKPRKTNAPPSSQHDQAGKVLNERRQYTVDWVSTAVLESGDDMKTSDGFTPRRYARISSSSLSESFLD